MTPETLRAASVRRRSRSPKRWSARCGGEIVALRAVLHQLLAPSSRRPGLYLEDLYREPAHRGRGIGQALLSSSARLAVERGYGRFEWSVLDWNENAIRFYERMGATVMPDWRICRIAGDALQALARAGR